MSFSKWSLSVIMRHPWINHTIHTVCTWCFGTLQLDFQVNLGILHKPEADATGPSEKIAGLEEGRVVILIWHWAPGWPSAGNLTSLGFDNHIVKPGVQRCSWRSLLTWHSAFLTYISDDYFLLLQQTTPAGTGSDERRVCHRLHLWYNSFGVKQEACVKI